MESRRGCVSPLGWTTFYWKISVKPLGLLYPANCRLQGLKDKRQEVNSLSSVETTAFRKFRKNWKNGHFLQSSTLKMVGLLQLKLPTSTPAGFLINGLIMNLLQYIFLQAENPVFLFPKSRGRIFLCVFPTFASPIEKPATSTHRRIWREIIGNTEENAKTVDSLRHC